MKRATTIFFVYKIEESYLQIKTNSKGTGSMFTYILVKNIDEANYWKDRNDAKSWFIEKQYPNAKLITCGLCEKK